ncbi:MAG: hypothetical protein JRJ65_06920 [Deltaproteobacteria bacterium]|nr:hypothetical protein [Deltaproteobacteria bacterium]
MPVKMTSGLIPNKDIFKKCALLTVPRVLGFCDRDRASKTYGCCDRYYWHYKLHDYYNARLQEAAYLFALAHELDDEENDFYHKKKLLTWARQAVRFWLVKRNRDGSVNETYPYERSFCATGFGLFIILSTLDILSKYGDVTRELQSSIASGEWLVKRDNFIVSNQECAAALALAKLGRLVDGKRYLESARKKVAWLERQVRSTGYHPEYGGMDIGYETITLSLLAHMADIPGFEEVKAQMKLGEKTISRFIREDGTWDINRCSRKTRFIYPFGLVFLGSPIVEIISRGLEKNSILNPLWMDDRYCINYAIDYLETAHFLKC